jgi:hypothetical protein
MSSIPDPGVSRYVSHSRIASLCLFCLGVAALMIAIIFGAFGLLSYLVDLVNAGLLAQASILMALAFFGSILFGALTTESATHGIRMLEKFLSDQINGAGQ